MSQSCAYCGDVAELTREHVVPNFIYKSNPLGKFGYNPRADAFINWEAQVKDVCARCNNQHLSVLDSYLKYVYKDNHIDTLITDENPVRFRYDFVLLCRALLKLSYNCLRFKGSDTVWLKPFSDYILYGVDYPGHLGVKLGVEVLRCHKITEEERKYMDGEVKAWLYLPPHVIRFGQIGGKAVGDLLVRYVFLKNYCFYIIIFQRSIGRRAVRKSFTQFSSVFPDVVFLDFLKKAATIKISNTDALDRYSDTARALADKWLAYVAKKG
jgi:hypothetical protein